MSPAAALLALLLVPAAACQAQARWLTGNDLHDALGGNENQRIYALGVLTGVLDAHDGELFCTPANATLGQVSDVVRRALAAAPQLRHESATVFAAAAMARVWPCREGSGKRRDRGTSL